MPAKLQPKQQTGSSPSNPKQPTTIAKDARQEFVENLNASISVKSEAEAKTRKSEPTKSGGDQQAINREVDHANHEDLMHSRIQHREPRANIKRVCMFDATSQGCKATNREKQAILNICGAVNP